MRLSIVVSQLLGKKIEAIAHVNLNSFWNVHVTWINSSFLFNLLTNIWIILRFIL